MKPNSTVAPWDVHVDIPVLPKAPASSYLREINFGIFVPMGMASQPTTFPNRTSMNHSRPTFGQGLARPSRFYDEGRRQGIGPEARCSGNRPLKPQTVMLSVVLQHPKPFSTATAISVIVRRRAWSRCHAHDAIASLGLEMHEFLASVWALFIQRADCGSPEPIHCQFPSNDSAVSEPQEYCSLRSSLSLGENRVFPSRRWA